MDRRSFSKLLAGAVTTAGMHGVNAAESKPALQKISMSDDRQWWQQFMGVGDSRCCSPFHRNRRHRSSRH